MKPKHVMPGYAHFDDGTGWPLPDRPTDEHESLEWILRYGQPTRENIITAAEYIAAYDALIIQTEVRRREIVRGIREAMSMVSPASDGDGGGGK